MVRNPKSGHLGPEEQHTAVKAAAHANTPSVSHFDTLGRMFLVIADNGHRGKYATRSNFDILGNVRSVVDAKCRAIIKYDYDMIGNCIHLAGMDAGERWILDNVTGKAILSWDSRDHRFRFNFNALMRPTQTLLREGDCPELLVGQITYGEVEPDASTHNLRGKPLRVFDQAGVVINKEYDFKANLLRVERRLAMEYNRQYTGQLLFRWKRRLIPTLQHTTRSTDCGATCPRQQHSSSRI